MGIQCRGVVLLPLLELSPTTFCEAGCSVSVLLSKICQKAKIILTAMILPGGEVPLVSGIHRQILFFLQGVVMYIAERRPSQLLLDNLRVPQLNTQGISLPERVLPVLQINFKGR